MNSSLEVVYRKHHSDRHRQDFAILEKERGTLFAKLIGSGRKVLDLGCRDGVITKYFVNDNEVTGVDVDSAMLEKAAKTWGIKTAHFDIQSDRWPVQASYFDVVVAGELLEHLYFPSQIVEKISRLLGPGGLFIGSVPNAFALKNRIKYLFAVKKGTPLEDPMHINHFSRRELEEMLYKNFKKITIFPLGKKYMGLTRIMPSLLGHSFAFCAEI